MRPALVIALGVITLSGVADGQIKAGLENQPILRVHNLYTDEQGNTHFRDINIEAASEGPDGKVSKFLPATGLIFRTTAGSYNYDWHTASRRQYVINLDASVRITVSDGESRVIGTGEVILIEDTKGKGHVSQAVDGKFRHSLFVTLD